MLSIVFAVNLTQHCVFNPCLMLLIGWFVKIVSKVENMKEHLSSIFILQAFYQYHIITSVPRKFSIVWNHFIMNSWKTFNFLLYFKEYEGKCLSFTAPSIFSITYLETFFIDFCIIKRSFSNFGLISMKYYPC